ncbi:MAG TPA: LemA family protein [Bacteroidales bacterium]|jgi:LemA protein|nr:LemA family protein [Bacteroidales bacterium]
MNKKWIILGVVVLLVIITYVSLKNGYNKMVALDEQVKAQWSQVENVYQRRADLIPNLVSTVKGAANFETTTLTQVIEARAKATQVKIDASNLNEQTMRQFQESQGALTQALSRLMVVSEQYPDLKANQNFRDLQAQIEGSENRITTERRTYNEVVQNYNTTIRSFPKNIFAGMFGFQARPNFTADAGANKAPEVKF